MDDQSFCYLALPVSDTLLTTKVARAPDIFQKSAVQCGELRMAEHGMWLIQFFQMAHLIRGQLD